jgi:YD repeat-containing protein
MMPDSVSTIPLADRPIQLTDAQGVVVTNQFDSLGRLLERKNAYGTILQNTYSAAGLTQHQDALSHLTYYGYDAAGRLDSVTNANGEINDFTYNPLDELATLTDGNGHVTSWTYDSYGHNVAKTDGNAVLIETNGYNAAGWVTAHWTPAKGLTSYSYDNNGNLTGITYSSGTNITAGYDALNRLTTLHDAVGNSTNTYANFGAFDGALASAGGLWANDTVSYTYTHHLQTALSLAQPSGSWSESMGYDGLARLSSLSSPAGTFNYSFNGAGRQINQLVLPGTGNEIDYAYDGVGSMISTALKHSGTVLDGYTYTNDANGNRIAVTRADNAFVNYGYDPVGQLTSATGYEPDGVTLRANENFGYAFDSAGNLMMRTNNTLVQTFSTDGANQLTSVTRNNNLLTIAGSLNGSNSFTMNGQPAIIYHDNTFAVTNGINNGLNVFTAIATSNSVTMTNKLLQVLPTTVNITYDANGNLISDGLHGFDYDCARNLPGRRTHGFKRMRFTTSMTASRSFRNEMAVIIQR